MYEGCGKTMKRNTKILTVLLIIFLVFITGCGKEKTNTKYKIVATNFPGYDFARAIIKDVDDISVKMLLKPGTEMHHYEPTPQDIIDIKESDIFIYVGGESDSWIEEILNDIDTSKTKIIKLIDYVDLYKEEIVEGMQGQSEDEYDEHIWTSPKNAIDIVKKIGEEISNLNKDNQEKYLENAKNYIDELNSLDEEIREIVNTSKRKELVFGDRFPLRYFTKEYNLTYRGAFLACSEQSEASSKTIAYLINYVKENNIPVVFKIELSSGNIANTISEETGATVLEFHSLHNISENDFKNGLTYIDLMKKNISALKIALN